MSDVFLEIVLNAKELASAGIESRDEIEDELHAALSGADLGEVTGGGGGSGAVVLDVEIEKEDQVDAALSVIRQVLQKLGVPKSTVINRNQPSKMIYRVYD